MTNALVPGSLSHIARQSGATLAETFIDAECIILVDTSGSMGDRDSRGGRSRYDIACEELALLQERNAGKIAVISFSDHAVFCPSGTPVNLERGTNMHDALSFAKIADVPGIRFILISDGEPDDERKTLRIAKRYRNRIDTIYVGAESRPYGRDFLQELSALSGGLSTTADRAQELYVTAQRLLSAGA